MGAQSPSWVPSQGLNAAASSVQITTSNILHFQQLPCIFLVSVPYKWGGYTRLKRRFLVRISMLPPPMSRLLPSGILHFQQPLCTISLHPLQNGVQSPQQEIPSQYLMHIRQLSSHYPATILRYPIHPTSNIVHSTRKNLVVNCVKILA